MEQEGRRLLKAKMAERGDTQAELSKEIGISLSRFNAKLNRTGGAEFSLSEVRAIKQLYSLSSDDVDLIFSPESILKRLLPACKRLGGERG